MSIVLQQKNVIFMGGKLLKVTQAVESDERDK